MSEEKAPWPDHQFIHRGLRISFGSTFMGDPHISDREMVVKESKVNRLLKANFPKSRAVYQDDNRSIVVWLGDDEDPTKARQWLHSNGIWVNEMFENYDLPMA